MGPEEEDCVTAGELAAWVEETELKLPQGSKAAYTATAVDEGVATSTTPAQWRNVQKTGELILRKTRFNQVIHDFAGRKVLVGGAV